MRAATRAPKQRQTTSPKSGIHPIAPVATFAETTEVKRRAIPPGAPDSREGQLAVDAMSSDIRELGWETSVDEEAGLDPARNAHTRPTVKP